MTYIAPPTVRARFRKRRPPSSPPKERPYPHLGIELGYVHYGIHTYDVHDAGDNGKIYQVALRYLAGGMARQAEQLIKQVATEGFSADLASGVTSCHIGYHWALAILRGRTFDQLGPVQMQDLKDAITFGQPTPGDSWATALNVVERILYAVLKQQAASGLTSASLRQTLADYQRLHPDRRDEIRRHLDVVLDGELADRLDAAHDADHMVQRLAADRASRVPKFFEPIPAPPKPVALTAPSLNPWQRWAAIIGSALAMIGLIAAMLDGAFSNVLLAALAALLLPISGFLNWSFARRVLAAYGRLSDRNRDYFYSSQFIAHRQISRYEFPPMVPQNDEQIKANPRHWLYRRMVRSYLTFLFRQAGAKSPDEPLRWSSETAGRSESMEREMLYLYESATNEPGSGDYLLRWHVDEVAEKFRARTLFSYQKQLSPRRLPLLGFSLGALFAVTSVVMALVLALTSYLIVGLGALVFLGAGLWLLWWSRIDVYLVGQERLPDDEDDRDSRLADEQKRYGAEVAYLADRPSDAEMARWLDYDLIQLKKVAMQQHGLANRDLLAHIAITEAGYMRRRARVVHGPWRYSVYTITQFLLTDEGVRVIVSDLDFATGRVTDEQRTDFTYSAVSAAKAAQITHRYDGARRVIVGDNEVVPAQAARPVRSNGFQVSISTGPPISVVLERFTDDYFNRAVEDLNQLKDNALDSSGVAAALRILEPVAAEGRQWLPQERLRRSRRLMSRANFMPFPFRQPPRSPPFGAAPPPGSPPSPPPGSPSGSRPSVAAPPPGPPPSPPPGSPSGFPPPGSPPGSAPSGAVSPPGSPPSGSAPSGSAPPSGGPAEGPDTDDADAGSAPPDSGTGAVRLGAAPAAGSIDSGETTEALATAGEPGDATAGSHAASGDEAADAVSDAEPSESAGTVSGAGAPAEAEPQAASSAGAEPETAGTAESAAAAEHEAPADPAGQASGEPDAPSASENPLQVLIKLSRFWRKPSGPTKQDDQTSGDPPSQ
jgi:hypothetical protein